MTPDLLDDVLAALDLSRAEPGVGLLEALFARFNARVPFETASKIARHAAVADPAEKPRRPEIFWNDHLSRGAGGTCFARVAAFDALLTGLGFRTRRLLGRVQRDFDHAALAVETPGGALLCDVGFPLPCLLPLAPGQRDSALGAVVAARSDRGLAVALGGVPEGPRALEIFLADVSPEEYERIWRATFREGSKFLRNVSLRLDLAGRAISYARGEVRVDDLHARLTVPLAPPRPARLAEIFGVEADLIAAGFALAGDDAPAGPNAALTAYLETGADPDRALGAIASPSGYRRLLAGVADVAAEEALAGGGFRFTLAPPASDRAVSRPEVALEERIVPDPGARRLVVERSAGEARSRGFYEARARKGGTHLLRGVVLDGPREDLLRNDSLRGRLAGSLAVDLLAWARLL